MITQSQWNSLNYFRPDDFDYPDLLDFSVVQAHDRLVNRVGSKPDVISDWREFDPENPNSQHNKGKALDTVWQVDPLTVWQKARDSRLFTGLGIYLNDRDAVSFHFDTRIERTPENPALWGDLIAHVHDPNTETTQRLDRYVSAGTVLAMLKKKEPEAIISLILSGYLIYQFTRS